MGQGAAEAALPLVVHACSSCTNPTSLRDWWVLGYQYWSANPAPVKLAPGDYPRPDRRRASALRMGPPCQRILSFVSTQHAEQVLERVVLWV